MFSFLFHCLSALTVISCHPQESSTTQEITDYQGLAETVPLAQVSPAENLISLNDPASNHLGQSGTVGLDNFHDSLHLMDQDRTTSNGELDNVIISDLGDDIRHASDQFNQDMDSFVKKIYEGADWLEKFGPENLPAIKCDVSTDYQLCCRNTLRSKKTTKRNVDEMRKRKLTVTGCSKCKAQGFFFNFFTRLNMKYSKLSCFQKDFLNEIFQVCY